MVARHEGCRREGDAAKKGQPWVLVLLGTFSILTVVVVQALTQGEIVQNLHQCQ